MKAEGYWDRFYDEEHPDLAEPTSFARYCAKYLRPSAVIFEIGCGNGRDALFFARVQMRVLASDASHVAIDHLREQAARKEWGYLPRFIARPMQALDDRHAGDIDAVYLRFVLHAVDANVAARGLAWVARNVRVGGLVFIEVRSVLGSLYGKGESAGRDAFAYDGHYRRFVRKTELTDELESFGFQLLEVIESDGLAIHGNDDPVVIRIIARRPDLTVDRTRGEAS